MADSETQEEGDRWREENYLAEFCQKIGVKFFFHAGRLWRSMGLRFYVPTPNSLPVSLTANELNLLWGHNVWFLQHAVPDEEEGFPSYAFLLRDKNYDLSHIKSSDRRHNIKRGMKHCEVTRISLRLLLREAEPLIVDTYKRQGRNCDKKVLEAWRRYFLAADGNPLFRAWGAFVGKHLAAAKIEFVFQKGVHPEALFSRTDLLKYYTMNVLLFISTKETMRSDDICYLSHGLRPITGEKESLANFKESMGLGKIECKERLEINPRVKPFLGQPVCSICSYLPKKIFERSEYVRLVAGIAFTYDRQIRYSTSDF